MSRSLPTRHRAGHKRRPSARGGLVLAALGLAALVPAAAAADPTVPGGFTISRLAGPPPVSPAAVGPDDIAFLDDHVFVGYQNGVPKTGPVDDTPPTDSLLIEYNRNGSIAQTFSLRGRIDGMASDPEKHRLIVTVNEDGNSSLYTVEPKHARVVHYEYSPNPSGNGVGNGDSAQNAVITGGGTDSVSVVDGQIFTAASSPAGPNDTAVFKVTLHRETRKAEIAPTFADNSNASIQGGGTTQLSLSDPDSTTTVPGPAPLFGGQFMLDSQADQQLIFVKDIADVGAFGPDNLTQLPLTHPAAGGGTTSAGVDDVRWTTDREGTLFVVDNKANAIYAISGPFSAFQPYASLDTLGPIDPTTTAAPAFTTEVASLDVTTGMLTPFATGFKQAKGLLWAPASGCPAGGDETGGGDKSEPRNRECGSGRDSESKR